jgi:hypothetical protein
MVDVYGTEPERKAALAEVTALRRQFDTTTAKGAAAFAKDPAAQAAMKRLDEAKSAAGMRTRAEDLAALNRIATSDTATMTKTADGKMTAAPTKAERAVTKELNAPSKQYFKQVQGAYKNPDVVPTWKPSKTLTNDVIETAKAKGFDFSKARYDWVWTESEPNFGNRVKGKGRWAIGLIGTKMLPPEKPFQAGVDDAGEYALKAYASDSINAREWLNFVEQNRQFLNKGKGFTNPFGVNIQPAEIVEALPDIRYSEIQEIIYQLTLEKDTDITIEDILDKYDEMFGEG